MPHTYSLQNVPSHVAAGDVRYRELLDAAAEARHFAPERTRGAVGPRAVAATLRGAACIVLVRLGVRLQGAAIPGATDTAPAVATGVR